MQVIISSATEPRCPNCGSWQVWLRTRRAPAQWQQKDFEFHCQKCGCRYSVTYTLRSNKAAASSCPHCKHAGNVIIQLMPDHTAAKTTRWRDQDHYNGCVLQQTTRRALAFFQ